MLTPTPAGQLRNLDPLILDNVGGVEALWYVDVADVLSVPDPDAPLISTDIVLHPGASWYQLVATRTTLGFTQDGKKDRHGVYFQPKLKGVLAKATATVAAGLEALDDRRFLLLYRDHNGTTWLVGAPDEPLTFSDKYDTGPALRGQLAGERRGPAHRRAAGRRGRARGNSRRGRQPAGHRRRRPHGGHPLGLPSSLHHYLAFRRDARNLPDCQQSALC
jgi:hypothetical protein